MNAMKVRKKLAKRLLSVLVGSSYEDGVAAMLDLIGGMLADTDDIEVRDAIVEMIKAHLNKISSELRRLDAARSLQ